MCLLKLPSIRVKLSATNWEIKAEPRLGQVRRTSTNQRQNLTYDSGSKAQKMPGESMIQVTSPSCGFGDEGQKTCWEARSGKNDRCFIDWFSSGAIRIKKNGIKLR